MGYVLDFRWVPNSLGELAGSMVLTAEMTLLACACGTAVGLVAALARRAPFSALRVAGTSYVEAIRNTPLLAQAFMIYFGIGSLGIRFDPLTAAVATLILNSGGYIAEIFRAGFESIHRSQREAAEAMGMTPLQAFAFVILPQATRNIYPALSAQYVLVLLGTSVMSQISAEELTAAASRIQSYNFRSLESYLVVAALYLVLIVAFKLSLAALGRLLFRAPYAAQAKRRGA